MDAVGVMKISATATKSRSHEGFIGERAVRPGHHGIGAHAVVAPDGIGYPFEDRLAEKGRGDRHQPRDDAVVGADHLLALVGDEIGPDEFAQSHDLRVVGIDVAARALRGFRRSP